jgi:hypothetical protein
MYNNNYPAHATWDSASLGRGICRLGGIMKKTAFLLGAGLLGSATAVELARSSFAVAVADISLDVARRM